MSHRFATRLHAVALLGVTACAPGPAAGHHEVLLRNGAFEPAALEVALGDTVTWRHVDIVPHTVTGGRWRSGELLEGETFTRVITAADLGRYACDYHPTMTGELRLRRGGSSPIARRLPADGPPSTRPGRGA